MDGELSAHPGSGRHGAWPQERILAELRAFLAGTRRWPSPGEFRDAGHGELLRACSRSYGGLPHWKAALGCQPPAGRPQRTPSWTDARIEAEGAKLRALCASDWPPSYMQAVRLGYARLWEAMRKYGGVELWLGRLGARAPAVGAPGELRPDSPNRSAPAHWSDELILATLAELVSACDGREPRRADAVALGSRHRQCWAAMYRRGGTRVYLDRLAR